MKISWFEILLIFAFRTSRQGSSRLRSIISVIDHPEGGYSTVVLHKNYVLGVLWSLNSIQTQYKRFWSIVVDTDIFFGQNPDFGSQIWKLFPGPSLKDWVSPVSSLSAENQGFWHCPWLLAENQYVLKARFENTSWKHVLKARFESTSWKHVLKARFERKTLVPLGFLKY